MSDPESPPRLSSQQYVVLQALLSGFTISEAAESAGVHRSTIYTWQRSHVEFRSALVEARRLQAETLRDNIQSIAQRSVETLRNILDDEKASPTVRLKAALAVIKSVESASPPIRQNSTESDTSIDIAA